MQNIKSVLCTPLNLNGKQIGVIYMDSKASSRQFDAASNISDESDWSFSLPNFVCPIPVITIESPFTLGAS